MQPLPPSSIFLKGYNKHLTKYTLVAAAGNALSKCCYSCRVGADKSARVAPKMLLAAAALFDLPCGANQLQAAIKIPQIVAAAKRLRVLC